MCDDFYQLLGLTPDTATPEDIKANYRKLALRYHPDRNPGDAKAEEMFKLITEAYATLSDPTKRADYDKSHNFGFAEAPYPFFDFTFRPSKSLWSPWPGDDIPITIELSFIQSLRGVNHYPLHITREVDCPKCSGRCARKTESCSRCHGTGRILDRTMMPQMCPVCNGRGALLTDPCDACSGLGRIIIDGELLIDIPCGVNNGSILRTALAGNGGHLGGQDGDLYSTIRIKNDSPYHREQQTLILKMKVPPETLILGGEVEVPLPLGGTQKHTVPPCSANNWSFAIPNHGVPRVGDFNHRGMLLVVLEAEFPTALTAEEEKLLKEYADLRSVNTAQASN